MKVQIDQSSGIPLPTIRAAIASKSFIHGTFEGRAGMWAVVHAEIRTNTYTATLQLADVRDPVTGPLSERRRRRG